MTVREGGGRFCGGGPTSEETSACTRERSVAICTSSASVACDAFLRSEAQRAITCVGRMHAQYASASTWHKHVYP